MPSIQIGQSNYTIAAVNFGTLTVTAMAGSDTSNLCPGFVGNLIKANGTGSVQIRVRAVESPGVVTCVVWANEKEFPTDLALYNGGSLFFEAQLAYSSGTPDLGPDGKVLDAQIAPASPTNAGAMPASAVAKLAALDQTALVALQETYDNGGRYELLEAAQDFDVTINSDTLGGWQLFAELISNGTTAQTIITRINEDYGNTDKEWWGNYQGSADMLGSAVNPGVASNSTSGIDGNVVKISLSCPLPSSAGGGPRVIRLHSVCYTNPTTKAVQVLDYNVIYKGTDNLAKIGFHSSIANGFAAGSVVRWARL